MKSILKCVYVCVGAYVFVCVHMYVCRYICMYVFCKLVMLFSFFSKIFLHVMYFNSIK